jgi:FlgN protein
MGANELSAELWRQRELLELLLFKYEEERLLLAAGKSRWIPHATREVEMVIGRLKTASLALSVTMVDVATEWGLPENARLRDVVQAAPVGVWKEIFGSHANALIELVADIRAIRAGNDQLLRSALRSTQETLNLIADSPSTYAADGSADPTVPTARLVDANL